MQSKPVFLRQFLFALILVGVPGMFASSPAAARTNCVGEAVPNPAYGATTGGHAVWLPGIGTNFLFIPTPGSFVQLPDGTATLTGTVFSKTNLGNGFTVDVQLSGYRTTPPSGSPKKDLSSNAYDSDGPVDTTTWVYYTNFTGTLTGLSNYAGAILTFVRTGPSFQVGFGANNKNINFGASAWFIWTVTRQPDNGANLAATGQGDFNIDLFPCNNGGEQCVTNAVADATYSTSTTTHAVFLPGIATDFIFASPGRFTQNNDGTATLTGLTVSRANPRNAFQVNAQFAGYTTNVAPGSPKKDLKSSAYIENGGPVDPATWSYYTTMNGTLTGVSNYVGAVLKIVRTGPAFQIGAGANEKNIHFGASGWFDWTVAHQPNSGSMSSGQGDFNLDLIDCPSTSVIVTPPRNQTNCPGSTAMFGVLASGPALTYQWLFDGAVLNGQTNNVLMLTNVSAADAGTYCVVVSSAGNGSETNCALLVVNENVIVTTPPANQAVCSGNTATFSITATGPALTYQWYFASSILNGETASALVLSNVTPAQAGTYTVVVSGTCAPPATNSATLTVNSNLIVTISPGNQTNCPGSTALFGVMASGTALRYQWLFGTSALAGQTNSTLVLSNLTMASAGIYSVVVSGACGNPVTNSASLVVNQNVIVTTAPANQTVCPNSTVLFRVTATGTALTYRWLFGTNILSGPIGSVLVLSNVTASQAGIYTVVVSGTCAPSVTNSATLTVSTNVIVTIPPAGQTNFVGSNAVFSVAATGTELRYQWFFGTNALTGQTNSTLALNNLTTNQAGTYCVIVSGTCGGPVTNCATLTIANRAPLASNDSYTTPSDTTLTIAAPGVLGNDTDPDGDALSAVLASNPARGTLTLNANGAFVYVPNADFSGTDSYTYVASDGKTNSNVATVTITVQPTGIVIVTAPVNQTNCPGSTAMFSVTATGTGLMYQWVFGTNTLSSQTNSTLVLSNVSAASAGTYCVIVSGANGAVTNCASLVVNQNVIVTIPPTNQTACPGSSATFSVTATGTALTYQWFLGANILNGQTSSTLVLSNVAAAQAGNYAVVVSGACAPPVTNSATLTVSTNVIVVTPPVNQTNCPGSIATFSVTTTGTALRYQWLIGTNVLAAQTNSTLVLSNVTANQAGAYSVIVSGACGSPVTNSVTLVVNQNVIVTTPPANQTACPGSSATFSVTATGTALMYQWFFGASILNGQTSSTLVLSNVTAAQAGNYTVVATGTCAPPVTNSATLTISTNVIVTVPPVNQTNCPGNTATFSVTAPGSALRYQWLFGTNVLVGQTNSTLVLSNVTATSEGVYFVVVSGACGSPVTNSAALIVNANVVITIPPANRTICPGDTALFSVSATGTALTYQWFFGANILNGQTSSTLVLSNVTPAQAGTYIMVVNGACAPAVTNGATLTVSTNVIVTVPLVNQTNFAGSNVIFSITATGTALRYQWFFGTNALPGQTNSTLALNNVTTNQAGTYCVVVSGICGTPITNCANLILQNRPPIANNDAYTTPADTTLTVGAPGVLGNDSDPDGDALTAVLVSNPTRGTLTLSANGSFVYVPNAGFSGSDTYTYVANDGKTNSNVATVTITVPPKGIVIVTAPANQTNCPGSTATFSVTATGTGLTYQWVFGTNALGGQTNSTLVLSNVSAASAGTYCVIVSGPGGAVTNCASLVVNQNVVVTSPPTNQTVCPGSPATFNVTATGTALTYQWFFGANPLNGQTTSTLVLSNVIPAQAGTYIVVVSGTCAPPVTNGATLTVSTNAIVTTPPANQTNCPGSTATFSITAAGSALRYQWLFGTNVLVGQTNSTLVLGNVTATSAGVYFVVVSGACGSPVTNSATLIVNANAVITTPLTNQTVCPGSSVTFSVTGTGTALTYQWFFGASILNGQTSSTLVLSNVTAAQAGNYTVVATGTCAPPATNSATLTVSTNVIVTLPPVNQTNCPGSTATFSVTATGSALRYQWLFGTNVLAGQTNSALVLNSVTANQAGTYSVIVSGACGNPVTNSATLIVNASVVVTAPPDNQTVCPGNTATFSVTATGTALNYQWLFGTNTLSGQTNSTLVLSNVTANQAGTYSVVVSGACAPPATRNATLTVSTNVVVTVPPANQTACPGSLATFNVTATGTALSYQWYFGTNILNGQTGSALVLSNVTPAQAGTYAVVVGGACVPPATNSATLIVSTNVIVTTPPLNQTNCSGSIATFIVTATGTSLRYQWFFGTNLLAVQTNSALVLNSVATNQAGTYSVIVSGACGNPVTNSATLVVNANVVVTTPPANQTACPGGVALFGVSATGTALTYQWYFGASILNGQTTSTLVLSNVTPAQAGTYTVVVSGACAPSVTNGATLIVSTNLIVTVPPVNQTNFVGSNVIFSVTATGTALRYQWLFGTNVLVDQTNSTLVLDNVAVNQAGTYCVVVSGACGTPVTTCATLILLNRPPIASNDAYVTPEDTTLTIAAPGILVNDTDPDGNSLTSILVSNVTHGVLMLSSNGSFIYRPFTNFTGEDVFLYRAFDGLLSSSPAMVRITVTPSNDPPVAVNDLYTTPENTTLTVPTLGVLANDNDVDGDPLMALLVAGPTNGSVTLFPNGSFVYVPRTNFFGQDAFTYRASDGVLQSGVAIVTILVIHIQRPPTVTIISPTNGSTFIAPANFAVIADAMDLDGVVTNVQIFSSTNLIGTFTNAPYLVPQTNLPPGIYSYFATATDNEGLRATSSVVSVIVTSSPPVTAVGPIVLDRDTGLFHQFVLVNNPTPQDFVNGVRVFVHLPPAITNIVSVWNATGTNANGLPYVDSDTPVPSGSSSIVLIQYYAPTVREFPTNVVLTAEPLGFAPAPLARPTVTSISQSSIGTTVEFTTAKKCMYYLQCSDDLVHWSTVPGLINGNGSQMQCTDAGSIPHRFYRVMGFH